MGLRLNNGSEDFELVKN